MGFYINPPTGTKEEWLAEHGIEITRDQAVAFKSDGADRRVVCLVDNYGEFTAAGIAYNDQERDYMASPDMSGPERSRKWFLVKNDDLRPYCNRV